MCVDVYAKIYYLLLPNINLKGFENTWNKLLTFTDSKLRCLNEISDLQLTINLQLRFIQQKALFRIIWIPSRTTEIGIKVNDMCWRNGVLRANLMHMFRESPFIHKLSGEVLQRTITILNSNIWGTKMFLLGNLSDITVSKTTQRPFLLRASVTAQKIDPLAVENIYNKLKNCEQQVRDRAGQGQMQNPHGIKNLPSLCRVSERNLLPMCE